VLIGFERKVLMTGGWFVLKEKYCWLVSDNLDEHGRSTVDMEGTRNIPKLVLGIFQN
jgi:hypothetical protein